MLLTATPLLCAWSAGPSDPDGLLLGGVGLTPGCEPSRSCQLSTPVCSMSSCSVPVSIFVYWKLGEVTSKSDLQMLCKAKCVARMGTPDSSHQPLIAWLRLLCCSFSIPAWGETRGKAENLEQCPNATQGCRLPPSLLGGPSSAPADHLPHPLPVPAGAIPC